MTDYGDGDSMEKLIRYNINGLPTSGVEVFQSDGYEITDHWQISWLTRDPLVEPASCPANQTKIPTVTY